MFNWTRDSAIVAVELAVGPLPTSQPLIDYVQFAQTCQNSASGIGHFDRASFFIDGKPRDTTDQADGPALQTLAILQMYAQLDAPAQAVASAVIAANLNFLQNAYQGETFNLWEEEFGASFFARSVQLKCFEAIAANTLGIPVPGWLSTAVPWLQNALASHWNGQCYQSLLPVPTDSRAPYDPNIDIVSAAIYGAVPVTDTKLLATAALLRSEWADPTSPNYYPINGADQFSAASAPCSGATRGTPTTVTPPIRRCVTTPGPFLPPTSPSCYYRLAQQVTTSRNGSARQSVGELLRPDRGRRLDRPRPRPRRRCRATAIRCCRRSSTTVITSSSASSSTPPPASRRASATCPGATPRSCQRFAPRTPSENPVCRRERTLNYAGKRGRVPPPWEDIDVIDQPGEPGCRPARAASRSGATPVP